MRHVLLFAALWLSLSSAALRAQVLEFKGAGADLQAFVSAAPAGATVVCQPQRQLVLSRAVTISKPLTLRGLNARLPERVGKTALLTVTSPGVALEDLELHGNYDSVSQADRCALVQVRAGDFRLERARFFDSTKDGVEVTPFPDGADLVGVTVREVEGFRLGRDAVSLSGGTRGQRVRQVVVENVRLTKGYLRGAVEVSDGTENVRVSHVYAEDCVYALDVQDHRGACAPNVNVLVEEVEAVNCRHLVRTANSPRGHANLVLRNLTARRCEAPVKISHTRQVLIDGLTIVEHTSTQAPPVELTDCQGVTLRQVEIQTAHFADAPVKAVKTDQLRRDGIVVKPFPE